MREIRQRDNPIPVLVLTARGGLHDRVHGLRSGADDYLVKPFALEELIARLEAQLRRPGQLLGNSLRIANLQFDDILALSLEAAGHGQHVKGGFGGEALSEFAQGSDWRSSCIHRGAVAKNSWVQEGRT